MTNDIVGRLMEQPASRRLNIRRHQERRLQGRPSSGDLRVPLHDTRTRLDTGPCLAAAGV